MDWRGLIEQHPNILCGKPVFKGTRVSVQMVLEHLGDGWREEELLKSFPTLRSEHLQAAMAYAAELVARQPTGVGSEG
jgi:uncharacterized protein (DUF433 family)